MALSSGRLSIALLGATGHSGNQVLEQALDRGHHVKALVRTPSKVTTVHENLKVEQVDIFDSTSLSQAFKGCDKNIDDTAVQSKPTRIIVADTSNTSKCNIVISCLGARRGEPKDTDVYGDSMRCIAQAMRDNKIQRIVTITSWGTYRDWRSPFFVEYFLRFIIASVLKNMRGMELYLQNECQDLDYTIVRPPGLSNNPLLGKPIQVAEECPCVPQGWCEFVLAMPRADVAKFMLDAAEQNLYIKQAVAILSK